MEIGVDFARDGAVATATLNRPETRNALKLDDLRRLGEIIEEVAADLSIRVLILTGSGDRAFSGGVDLSDVSGGGAAWDEKPLTRLCDALEALPRVTIARLNGAVIGGAAELTCACDFRVAAEGVRVMVPAAKLGVHYEPSGLSRAVAAMGLQTARRVYLLAEAQSAEALSACGYLDALVAREALDEAVASIAGLAAAGAPLAVDGMKLALSEIAKGALDEDAAAARIRQAWGSEDMAEGLAAMREKRPPAFKGK